MISNFSLEIKEFRFASSIFSAYIPEPAGLFAMHQRGDTDSFALFWGRVWPSSIGMCCFLSEHLPYVQDKKVLEIAAGLGLPSLLIAPVVNLVTCTDISSDAMELAAQSAALNGYGKMNCSVADWSNVTAGWNADILLLSDVNYSAEQLDDLHQLIEKFLAKGGKVILSTPERIVARTFLMGLASRISEHEEMIIEGERIHVYVYH